MWGLIFYFNIKTYFLNLGVDTTAVSDDEGVGIEEARSWSWSTGNEEASIEAISPEEILCSISPLS